MKKLISLFLSFTVVITLCSCSQQQKKYSKSFLDLFDTVSSITAYDTSQKSFDEHYALVYAELEKYSKLFDIYNTYDDVVSLKYVNENAAEKPVEVSAETIELLQYAKKAYALTDGKTNVCMGSVLELWHSCREKANDTPENAALPSDDSLASAAKHMDISSLQIDAENNTVSFTDPKMKIDVGAIAKGFACNKIRSYINENNIWQCAVISLGGNVITIGEKPDGSDFTIAIENPNGGDYLKKITVSGSQSVATSSSSQRYFTYKNKKYSHIIDPDSLYPAEYVQSVSVISSDSALADAMSTALFCMPLSDGKKLVENNDEIEAVWLDADGNIVTSSGVK